MIRSPSETAGQHFDYVVCTHKAVDPHGAIIPLDPVVDENNTTIVVLQNGVGNEDPFRERFPSATIISGVVRLINSLFLYTQWLIVYRSGSAHRSKPQG